MKLRIECKEVLYRSVEIDTDDYGVNTVFEMAELINKIQDDPKDYISDNLNDNEERCLKDSDIKVVTIEEVMDLNTHVNPQL